MFTEPLEKQLYLLLDELGLNMTVKRHAATSKFDARIYHRWISNPILSSCAMENFQDCINEFVLRIHAIENMRTRILKINKKREEHFAKQTSWDTPESIWEEWI